MAKKYRALCRTESLSRRNFKSQKPEQTEKYRLRSTALDINKDDFFKICRLGRILLSYFFVSFDRYHVLLILYWYFLYENKIYNLEKV